MTTIDLLVKNARIVTPHGLVEAQLSIDEGKIIGISSQTPSNSADKIIDAGGKLVIPGVVDTEAHPGHGKPFGDDMKTESRAALAYGVTTWGIQNPVTRLGGAFKETAEREDVVSFHQILPTAIELGEKNSAIDFFFTPMIETDQHANEIPEYAEKYGVNSFKFYGHCKIIDIANEFWQARRTGLATGFNDGTVFVAMENVAKLNPPGVIAIHCENYEIARVLIRKLKSQGRNDLAAWSDKTPPFVEAHQVVSWSYLAGVTGARLYVQHVTTRETINQINRAKTQGVKIYGQTAPAYLSLSNENFEAGWRLNVPIRDRDTVEYLWGALKKGFIDCIGSDHVALFGRRVYEEDKKKRNVWETRSGFSSRVESILPVMLSEGVNKRGLSPERLVQVACENPAKIFGIYPSKGAIAVGSDADLVVLDLKKTAKLTSEMVFTVTGWSIYEGRTFMGWPVMTIRSGEVAVEWPEGEKKPRIVAKPYGVKYLRRESKRD